MLKTPRFLLTAGLVLALAFTFSCSGDDGDSPPATLPSSSDSGVSQLPSSPSVAPSSSSEDAALSSSSHDEELVEVSSSSEEESSSSATPPPYIPPYNPPYIPPVTPSSSSSSVHVPVHCEGFTDGAYFNTPHGGGEKQHFCDKRDGEVYAYVTIDNVPVGNQIVTQTWMAQNLNYDAPGSKCYDDEKSNCEIYGRLYNWETAMELSGCKTGTACASLIQPLHHRGICPEGWHIPFGASLPNNGGTASGWTALRNYIAGIQGGRNNQIGDALKAKSDLWSTNTSTDDYGFSALPAGYYDSNPITTPPSNPGYYHIGTRARWWMASYTASSFGAAYQEVNLYKNLSENSPSLSSDITGPLYSVRCMKDD